MRYRTVLLVEARATGAKIFFADGAPFRADGDLRGEGVPKGRPALVDSTCPRWGEKAGSYSAVCLGTGEVEAMGLTGTSSSATSAAFLQQLRANHAGPLIVIRDNGPAHGGEAVRDYLATPGNGLRLLRPPARRPDFNADEAIWAWGREGVTANTCPGATADVRAQVAHSLDGLKGRTGEVPSRCRTGVQALAEGLAPALPVEALEVHHGDPTCAAV